MGLKRIVTVALTAFVLVSVGYVIYTEGASRATPGPETVPASDTAGNDDAVVYAYYFHGNVRCVTCKNIEANMRQVVEENFADEVKNGSLVMNVLNIDEPVNEHFVKDFELAHNGVVLVVRKGTEVVRFEELAKVWELTQEPETMRDYLTDATLGFLGSAAS